MIIKNHILYLNLDYLHILPPKLLKIKIKPKNLSIIKSNWFLNINSIKIIKLKFATIFINENTYTFEYYPTI